MVPPAGTTERGRYEQLVSCIQTELDAQGLWIHRKHEALGKYFGSIPEAVAHAREHFKSVLGVLLDELADSGGDYLLASGFSAADILLVHCITWASAVGWLPTSELSDDKNRTLARYLKRCTERPAHVRAAQLRNSSKM